MRLVKIKISRSTPFWILDPIRLDANNPYSPYLDVDLLNDKQINIINKSVKFGDVRLLDGENNFIKSIDELKTTCGFAVDFKDVKNHEEDIPEVVSVTIEEEPEEEEGIVISDAIYADAVFLLNKNGNTVRKIIKELPINEDALTLLHACLEEEVSEKNRIGIIKKIKQKIMEF